MSKYTRASRRARWNQRIAAERDPLARLKLAADFARAAAQGAPAHLQRRALGAVTEDIRRAAVALDTAMEKAEKEAGR